ncbi:hypothetical protein [Streptomyces sp. NBC_00343]|uniref:hypothetical protein n=1 Tax=Streptomyces sp. NBC_00343 TaxID=2975719 RepID=UPI002E2AAE88|nr:hypothetical protein [Streptomyces sp. NBC_00343]
MFQLEQRDAKPVPTGSAAGIEPAARAGDDAARADRTGDGPYPVFITSDGTVAVDGEIIARATSGDAAQTVVLDHLQQRAMTQGVPVEASVLDQQRRTVLRIRVREDGASELLEDPISFDDPGAPAMPPAPEPESAGAARQDTRRDQDTAVLTAVGTPVPARPEPLAVPDEFRAAAALVCETITSGELPSAKAQAAALARQSARRFGPEHLYTLEARALEAYVAHLMGDHATATTLWLQVAELRHQQDDPRAREDVERAVVCWELIASPFNAVPLGKRLLALWNLIGPAEETERYTAAERRLATLAQVTPPAFAVSLTNMR